MARTSTAQGLQGKKAGISGKWSLLVAMAMVLVWAHASPLWAGEYTNRIVRIGKAEYKAESNEKLSTVDVFNEAVKYAIQDAENQGEAAIMGGSTMSGLNLGSMWVKKEANLQVVDIEILEKDFVNNDRRHVKVRARVTFDYLNVPKFMYEYDKTVTGAAVRSIAIPGWGQMYNNTSVTGVLYGVLFGFFYYSFITEANQAQGMAGNKAGATELQREEYTSRMNSIVASYQLPSLLIWSFALSEATASRALAKIGLRNLKEVYRLGDYNYVRQTNEDRFVVDFYLFHFRF